MWKENSHIYLSDIEKKEGPMHRRYYITLHWTHHTRTVSTGVKKI